MLSNDWFCNLSYKDECSKFLQNCYRITGSRYLGGRKQHYMELLLFSTRWGSELLPLSDFVKKSADAGYDGIEIGIPASMSNRELEDIIDVCERQGSRVILQHYDTYEPDFEKHKVKYKQWLEKIQLYHPFLVNSQTGRDFFSMKQNLELITIAHQFFESTGIPVVHETHRNKFSFACHITHQYLVADPKLHLAFDISHWVNVAESFLEDQPEAVELALSRTRHIHSRVGFPEGPQIPDPRDPRWKNAVEIHFSWWDRIIQKQKTEAPDGTLSVTPEFGPYPYMMNLPFTDIPLADQWEINLHMMQEFRKRYVL